VAAPDIKPDQVLSASRRHFLIDNPRLLFPSFLFFLELVFEVNELLVDTLVVIVHENIVLLLLLESHLLLPHLLIKAALEVTNIRLELLAKLRHSFIEARLQLIEASLKLDVRNLLRKFRWSNQHFI